MIWPLLVSAALAGDGTGYAHMQFGLTQAWGGYDDGSLHGGGTGGSNQARATMVQYGVVGGVPVPLGDVLFLDVWGGFEIGVGGGKDALGGVTADDLLEMRWRAELGPALVLREEGFQAWLRLGGFLGWDSVPKNISAGQGVHQQNGWSLRVGVRPSVVGLEVALPIGRGDRLLGARLLVLPINDGRGGVAVSYERVVDRWDVDSASWSHVDVGYAIAW